MKVKLSLFSSSEIFLGVRFGITKLVTDLSLYDPKEDYPRAYSLEFGFLFGTIEFLVKGSS
jgi:hypothetical protein